MELWLIIISVCLIIIVWTIYTYNRFILHKNRIREAWSNIDVQLKRRYDLIPNLIEAVKRYMAHEKNVLETVTEKRNQCVQISDDNPSKKLLYAENMLAGALGQFWALVENYPDLKANDTFLKLQTELSDVEDHIQLSRRYFNGTVRDFNILVESFPSNLIAKLFHFQVKEFFQIENPMERLNPKVNLPTDR